MVTFQPDTPGETVVEANLTPAADGRTRLIVEERGFPLAEIAGHGGGWQLHAEDLSAYLGGHEPGDWQERWVELKPFYQALADDLT
jgi:hypothetical protein